MKRDPRYPLGNFVKNGPLTQATRSEAIGQLAALPNQLHDARQASGW